MQAGKRVVVLEIVDLLLGAAALLGAHPGDGDRRRDADAEQEEHDAGDQAEIVRKCARLVALVEIDDERATLAGVER